VPAQHLVDQETTLGPLRAHPPACPHRLVRVVNEQSIPQIKETACTARSIGVGPDTVKAPWARKAPSRVALGTASSGQEGDRIAARGTSGKALDPVAVTVAVGDQGEGPPGAGDCPTTS
jgi:hypothetical protein